MRPVPSNKIIEGKGWRNRETKEQEKTKGRGNREKQRKTESKKA